MGNTSGIRHYYIEAFTPYGYVSLLPELLKEIKYTYLLTGGPGTGKSTMMKLIGIQMIDRGNDVDYIRSIREADSVAGLYLPKHKICLLDKDEFNWQINFCGPYHREIDFSSFCRQSRLEEHSPKISQLGASLADIEQDIIVQLRKDYMPKKEEESEESEEDSHASQNKTRNLDAVLSLAWEGDQQGDDSPHIDEITRILSRIKANNLSFYFLHSLQLEGWLNLAPRYIRDFDRICLDGEESAHLLRVLLEEVKCLGQAMEIIVHPLKPYTIVGLLFPEKNLAVWKGNPCRIEEQGFRMGHSTELIAILEQYRKNRLELKNLINDSVNFRGLDHFRSELLSSILTDLHQG
ncbi:hypothetical protein [Dehalobacter restrictus]|uniref:ATPase n=1 Tax=Dehalobacter restrictus TaxID=55583 RepID=A0A857DMW9_9FIRM|nr:hypothetical protein [Dehalobacter restrictus]QHA01705.1 hypothetical protein GQ588_14185 [Dehalobacter restrictus]